MNKVFTIKAIKSKGKKRVSLKDLHRRLDRLLIAIGSLLQNRKTKSKKK
jgi:hypothetical protein